MKRFTLSCLAFLAGAVVVTSFGTNSGMAAPVPKPKYDPGIGSDKGCKLCVKGNCAKLMYLRQYNVLLPAPGGPQGQAAFVVPPKSYVFLRVDAQVETEVYNGAQGNHVFADPQPVPPGFPPVAPDFEPPIAQMYDMHININNPCKTSASNDLGDPEGVYYLVKGCTGGDPACVDNYFHFDYYQLELISGINPMGLGWSVFGAKCTGSEAE